MKVAIVKYNAGNVRSVSFVLERLGIQAVVTDDVNELLGADKVIFPGVGEASTAMHFLKEKKLDEVIVSLKQPVLGICLGMQLMCDFSEEGNVKCLGIFDTEIKQFSDQLKAPQIGWNNIFDLHSALFQEVNENEYMYFVHSYYAALSGCTIAAVDYGIKYSAALQKNNFYAVQFHPEKSSIAGQKIIENFINI